MQTHTSTYKLHSLIQYYNKACGSAHDSPHSPQGHLDLILRVGGAAQLCPTAAYHIMQMLGIKTTFSFHRFST